MTSLTVDCGRVGTLVVTTWDWLDGEVAGGDGGGVPGEAVELPGTLTGGKPGDDTEGLWRG